MNLREDRIFEEEKFTRIQQLHGFRCREHQVCGVQHFLPAEVEYLEGKMWFLGDKLHRRDGPAVEWDDGDKEWWFEGKKHREDGPAIENADGYKAWWVDGERVE